MHWQDFQRVNPDIHRTFHGLREYYPHYRSNRDLYNQAIIVAVIGLVVNGISMLILGKRIIPMPMVTTITDCMTITIPSMKFMITKCTVIQTMIITMMSIPITISPMFPMVLTII